MITTVTTTVTIAAALGFGTALAAVATVALILFLAQREVLLAAGPRFRRGVRNMAVSIIALLATFAVIVVARLAALMH